MDSLVLDLVEPLLVAHILLVEWPILNCISAVVDHTVPVLVFSESLKGHIFAHWGPHMSVLTPVNWFLLSEDGLIFLRILIDIVLDLQQFILVNGEH